MTVSKSSISSVSLAAECLLKGGVAVLPTDTVYGFSGAVDVPGRKRFYSDDRIRAIKGRSESKPLIELIASPKDIYLYTDVKIPQAVMSKWPGALTVIVPVKKDVPLFCDTPCVAFRCPGDEWIRKVIELCGCPVYSTSVNRSGSPVLDTISAIKDEFGSEADLIVEDGDKKGCLPSTLVRINGEKIEMLRQGSVTV